MSTALGALLRRLRDARGLNFREVAQLAKVDHAYIQRLETGAKTSPSEEVLTRLIKALKAPKREGLMLPFLARHPDTLPALVDFVEDDDNISFEEFRGLATLAHRGTGRPDYAVQLARLRAFWDDDDG
ncbi:MAG: helix-turn-helix transcriptional regulator [Sphingomicrobium sp.]